MDGQIQYKRNEHKDSAADLYRATRNWLHRFMNGRGFTFRDITVSFVDRFKVFIETEGNLRVNSVNTYLSNFRVLYNRYVSERNIRKIMDPFCHLSLHQEKTLKRSVSIGVLEEIALMDLKDEPELQFATDLCLFSFMCCGIPFIDLAHLTKDNIKGNEIIYYRIKTGVMIRIGITPGLKYFLDKYHRADSEYLFPILPTDEEQTYEGYKSILYRYNSCLKEIGSRLEIPLVLTSYVFRHTWATEALRCFIQVSIISQALGHTSEKTTRCYLDQLDQSELNKANTIVTQPIDYIIRNRA